MLSRSKALLLAFLINSGNYVAYKIFRYLVFISLFAQYSWLSLAPGYSDIYPFIYPFTCEKSKEIINFLDVVIKLKGGRIITDLYCKPLDGHQYLHYDSCHADHIKRSIMYSQTLQLKRIYSEKNDLNVRIRGYPGNLTEEQVEKALRLTLSDEDSSKKVNGISLVVAYNPAFKNLSHVIRKNLQLLYADKQVRKVFSPVPFVSFRSIRKAEKLFSKV